ncbi:nitrous oxide reductase family maturation protein NosD [Bacillus sp. ISL-47]|uniref:nitrous oxide reductase family maturation protein NosD n=1 Tax=Bacillus sp. ISL-47 TaxID=2819130 RepID=UPI001BEA97CF|nr:nitrous oxide reductase family maturation protein NosD [Bacillus sp. ISL-47]MBT2688456.1 nitrous oxide reductase family maturation protein NosD [Bacillus sp. ISL-47]MBT2707228.1 nitrous oxide reductase family maturation protein NosD [Pseudomonas sp. ISL-84]
MEGFKNSRGFITFSIWIIILLSIGSQANAAEKIVVPGDSIQKAISHSKAGDTIKVEKGLYKESISISKSINLVAENGAILDGGGRGNVITIKADDVTIQGLSIRNSGKNQNDSGIYLKNVNDASIHSNSLTDVTVGVYTEKSSDNLIQNNWIESYDTHFSKRGNGIHLYYGEGNVIEKNTIQNVQDGIYFDFAKNSKIYSNTIKDSRYGFHFMFSSDIEAADNTIEQNITGLMVMDSERLQFERNKITEQFHFRGYGILIYDSADITLENNEIRRNSTGLYFEEATNTVIHHNLIAANQVGLEFKGENTRNSLSENNFIGNIVSSKVASSDMRLDHDEKGNYWDDYNSFDLTGDGIGEEPYKAGSLYDSILENRPYWQFYFESPAIQLWSKAESMFPSLGTANVYDQKPLIQPVKLDHTNVQEERGQLSLLLFGVILMAFSIWIIMKGRK